MKGIIEFTVRLVLAVKRTYTRKWSFLGVFALVFFGSVAVLGQMDLLPDTSPASAPSVALAADSHPATSVSTSTPVVVSELPTKIEVPAINLVAVIANPTTTDVEILDQNLLAGAVRYPTSAKLGEIGNVVLFGHSSYLPVVGNQAYKTFNGIQKLVEGDIVTVSSSDTAYTYRVRSVAKESAASDAGIPLEVTGRVLTLSTCNSFGAKTDRFVVTADFVESHSLST
jgi:LPXTG-site transpeptidase (sortase) family protein